MNDPFNTYPNLIEEISFLKQKIKELEQSESEHKKAEEELRESEDKYRTLIETTDTGFVIIDKDGLVLDANLEYVHLTGHHSLSEIIGRSVIEWTADFAKEKNTAAIKAAFEKGNIRNLEIDYMDSKGNITPIEINATSIEMEEKIQIITICRNITERKRAEAALRESEERYRSIFENAIEGMYQTSPEGRYLNVNPALAKMHGFESTQEMITAVTDIGSQIFISPEARQKYRETLEKEGNVVNFEFELYRKDRSKLWVSTNARVVRNEKGEILYYEGKVEDITKRRQAEEAVKKSEEQYRIIFENAIEGIFRTTLEGRFINSNPALAQMLGYDSPEDLISTITDMGSQLYTNPEDRDTLLGLLRKHGFVKNFEVQCHHKNGSIIWGTLNMHLAQDDHGNILYIEGTAQDITERKQAEKALQHAEKKYRDIFENAVMGIFQTTEDGRYLNVNPAGARIYGYDSPEEMISSATNITHQIYVDPEDRKRFKQMIEAKGFTEGFETEHYRKDGSKIWVSMSSRIIRDAFGTIYETTSEDITKRKHLEAQLIQAQKMEAIGTLAGGIAHDFNNLLMGIQGYASLIMLDLSTGHPHYERLKHIEDLVKNASDLTGQLLGFARGGKYVVKPISLNELIEKTSAMFGRTKKEITIHRKYERDIWVVEADQGQIEQVLLNLYLNAWQAMPAGGDLSLETRNVFLNDSYAKPYLMMPGRYVRISVSDTGVGMDEKTKEKIFEPFFTTKSLGRGTGLGLAMVYGILKNHNGFIDVISEPGKGTTFALYFPVSEKGIVNEKPVAPRIMRGKETILLVDDETHVLEVSKAILESLGYTVYAVKNGEEAIVLYKQKKDEIDIVILDMIMPGLSGSETFDSIKAFNPAVRAILSSGYSLNDQAQQIMHKGCHGFIQKPFDIIQLSRKIREVLEK